MIKPISLVHLPALEKMLKLKITKKHQVYEAIDKDLR